MCYVQEQSQNLNLRYTLRMGLVAEDGSNPHALVWTEVVNNVADDDIRHLVDGASRLGVVVSAA